MLYDVPRFIGGFIVGIILSIAWSNALRTKFGLSVISDEGLIMRGLKGPAVLEHYHVGLFFFIIAVLFFSKSLGFLEGLGISLIAVEAMQKNPFAIGKAHFPSSTAIGFALFILLAILYIK